MNVKLQFLAPSAGIAEIEMTGSSLRSLVLKLIGLNLVCMTFAGCKGGVEHCTTAPLICWKSQLEEPRRTPIGVLRASSKHRDRCAEHSLLLRSQ